VKCKKKKIRGQFPTKKGGGCIAGGGRKGGSDPSAFFEELLNGGEKHAGNSKGKPRRLQPGEGEGRRQRAQPRLKREQSIEKEGAWARKERFINP